MVISFFVRFDRNFYYVYLRKRHSLLLIYPSIVFETPLRSDTTVPVRLTLFQQHIRIIRDRRSGIRIDKSLTSYFGQKIEKPKPKETVDEREGSESRIRECELHLHVA